MKHGQLTRMATTLSIVSLPLIMPLMVVLGLNFVKAQGTDPYTFPVNSSPYGVPYKDWTAKWAAWLDGLPKSYNWDFRNAPGVNYVPKDCSYGQDPSSPVFFLPWIGPQQGTTAVLTCIVP